MTISELKPINLRKNTEARPYTSDTSGIRPTEFNVLLRADKVEEVTKGGIIVPEATQNRLQAAAVTGRIIAVSPLAFSYERWPDGASKPMVGDRVAYQKYAGMKITGSDGVDYILAKDKDVAAVID